MQGVCVHMETKKAAKTVPQIHPTPIWGHRYDEPRKTVRINTGWLWLEETCSYLLAADK